MVVKDVPLGEAIDHLDWWQERRDVPRCSVRFTDRHYMAGGPLAGEVVEGTKAGQPSPTTTGQVRLGDSPDPTRNRCSSTQDLRRRIRHACCRGVTSSPQWRTPVAS